jgi:hypothetical protein
MSVKATVDQLNGNAAQPTTEKAKGVTSNVVASAAAFIEDVLLPNIGRIQTLLLAGLALAQGLLKRNRKNAAKNASNVQDTVTSTAKTSLNKAQDVAQSGLSTAQDVLQKNVKRASKDLKKAQKSMKVAQKAAAVGSTVALSKTQDVLESSLGTAQDVLQSGLGTSQEVLQKNVKRARKELKKAGESVKDVGETVQHTTSRFLFRTGLVTGLVLILLFTPWPGSETRARLADLFQQARENLSNLVSGS